MTDIVIIIFLILLVIATINFYAVYQERERRRQAELNELNALTDKIIKEMFRTLLNSQSRQSQQRTQTPQRPVIKPAPTSAFLLLGLPITATEIQIKSQFKKLAMKHHPDKGGRKEVFQQIVDAKELCIKYSSQKSSI